MERPYVVSLLCLQCAATLAVASRAVRCQPMNDRHRGERVRPADSAERNVAEDVCRSTAADAESEIDKEERADTVARPPQTAGGLFRDPADVLGHKFSPSVVVNLCEVQLRQRANEISEIKFTDRGNKTCQDLCVQYRSNMRLNGPVTVVLLDSYCDYAGTTVGFVEDDDTDLTATCTCMYKMRCNQRSKVVLYVFESNCKGFLKVSVTELKKKNHIT